MERDHEPSSPAGTILFVCLHGSAKSLIAAQQLGRLAESRGLALRAVSAGVEPDADVPPNVVAGLAADGFDVQGYRPRSITPGQLASAHLVITMGCELGAMTHAAEKVERWDDLPMVSEGYVAAREAIVARVEQLLSSRLACVVRTR